MKSDARASLDDLAIRWETPRGREIKAEVLQDIRYNKGERLADILKDFIYVGEVPDGRDLRCITLEELELSDTTWKSCDLSWASFARSTLTRADFRNANLKRANLVSTDLKLARFAEADCARADFTKANLEHANFKDSKLNGAVFVQSNCSRASFDSANLAKCNFVGANLEQASLANADCNNGNFSGSALESVAAKPSKAWGVVYDMPLEEFERKVGLNSLTSRTTKKFKGLDVLLKASAALAKVQKKTSQMPALDEAALGAPPGMKRLDTFKRPADDGGDVVFGAGLRRKTEELKAGNPSDVATAADYLEDAAATSFDPDDPQGNAYPNVDAAAAGAPDESMADEAVGAVWTDGRTESGEHLVDDAPAAEASPPPTDPATLAQEMWAGPGGAAPGAAPPRADVAARQTIRFQPGAVGGGPAPNPGTRSLPRPGAPQPAGAAPGAPAAGRPPVAPPRAPGAGPPTGQIRVPGPAGPTTKGLGRPPVPGGAPGPAGGTPPSGVPRPATGAIPIPGGARTTRPLGGPPTGAVPIPGATPVPGAPRAPTRALPPRPVTGAVPVPQPAAPPAAPSFMAPLDPSAADPTGDWAKAIGQLMQSKASITKIVIETGDKSRIIFKKG